MGRLHRSWASIEGADVCPDCQTPNERRELGLRIIAWIEAEIERRRRGGRAPDEIESGLIAYAMSVREGLEARSSRSEVTDTRPTDRPDTTLEAPPRMQLQVAMTAAFFTGKQLSVRIADYHDLQSALAGALRGGGWRVDRLHAQGGTYNTGGGFAEALPLVVARRTGPELLGHLRDWLKDPSNTRQALLAQGARGYHLTPTGLSIDVYDLGVAVLTAWFDVSAPRDVELSTVARTVMDLALLRTDRSSPIAQALQEIARDTAEQYRTAVQTALPPDSVEPSWPSARVDDRGRLLWLHPVHVLEEPTPSEEIARRLAPVFHRTINVSDAVFAPGVDSSAIVTVPRLTGATTSVRLVQLTQLHWAYYALYMDIDRGLLSLVNEGRRSKSTPLKGLERDADNAPSGPTCASWRLGPGSTPSSQPSAVTSWPSGRLSPRSSALTPSSMPSSGRSMSSSA